ncbi:hypothetical protein HMI54_010950 [Coelomomyces lativittatus]|nr:hypothetical protein HMI54_010950 [Coelomomyces lativittatus]
MNSQQPPTDTQTFSTSSLPLSAANDIDSSMKQAQTLSSAVSSETSSNDITTTYPIFGQIAYGAMLYPTLVPLTGNKKEERKVALSSYQSPSFQTSSQIPNNVSLDSTSSSSLLTMTSSTSISTPTQTLTPSLPTYSQEETEKHTSDATTCKPCEKSFDSIDQFENHKKTHVTCSECSFEAIKSLVQKHNEEVHGRNKEKNSMPPNCIRLDTPEDIEKWIAERKKNYPTDTNIQLKNERQKKLHQQEQNGLKIFQPPPFPVTPTISKKKPTSRPSLMSKLLEKERIQDHSFLLQCCRFFVNNKFFINGLIWLPSNDSSSS